jgi:thymidylate synthase
MRQYLDQLRTILTDGTWKDQRAVLADGSRVRIKHVFGLQARYDLAHGFPLVTTKRVPFRLVAEELFWFLAGSTDNSDLRKRDCKIWDEWADESGDLGPIYGKQWRAWDAPGGGTVDQVAQLVDGIRAVVADPFHKLGRRLILTAWNPADIPKMRGPFACHTLSHFVVTDGKLHCHMFQRSADMFLGVPFNIASYALLTHLLATVTGLGVGTFVHSISDGHIYENHLPQVEEQLSREPRPLPTLTVSPRFTSLDAERFALTNPDRYRVEDLTLTGYDPHPRLAADVAI